MTRVVTVVNDNSQTIFTLPYIPKNERAATLVFVRPFQLTDGFGMVYFKLPVGWMVGVRRFGRD